MDLASVAVLRADQLVLPSISLVQVYGVSVILCQMATFLSSFVKVFDSDTVRANDVARY